MQLPSYVDLLAGSAGARPTGIWFNNRRFSEPQRFFSAALPLAPGIYAILVPDETCKPRKYRVIYFGEGGNLSERVTAGHERYADWCRVAYGAGNLYAALYPMAGVSDGQRKAVEAELIKSYDPQCNSRNKTFEALYNALLRVQPRPHVAPRRTALPSTKNTLAARIAAAKRYKI